MSDLGKKHQTFATDYGTFSFGKSKFIELDSERKRPNPDCDLIYFFAFNSENWQVRQKNVSETFEIERERKRERERGGSYLIFRFLIKVLWLDFQIGVQFAVSTYY